jgi:hypothetical protein
MCIIQKIKILCRLSRNAVRDGILYNKNDVDMFTSLKDDEKEPADYPDRKMLAVVRSISKVSRESWK